MRTTQSRGEPPLDEPDLGIWFDGRTCHYQEDRHDILEDAIAYAKVVQRRPGYRPIALPQIWEQWLGSTSDEADLMATFGIDSERGTYRYREFHYDFLEQALDYARRISAAPTEDAARPRKAGIP
ncbi:hypothetical protein [Massilia horti]|uniref:Uncharacterized protein n=1 Tax=Massilia horti TaxID=2562153 RepID=A0A4Y9T155_9BURK|nr:hypothetical protein [Massilia horti]TFW32933.1 hypothetical protein E4O92_08390 [Massilia horti]